MISPMSWKRMTLNQSLLKAAADLGPAVEMR